MTFQATRQIGTAENRAIRGDKADRGGMNRVCQQVRVSPHKTKMITCYDKQNNERLDQTTTDTLTIQQTA